MRKFIIILLLLLFICQIDQAKSNKNYRSSSKKLERNIKDQDNKQIILEDQKSSELKCKKSKNGKKICKDHSEQQHSFLKPNQPAFWWNTLLAVFLSCAGGFFSGMTVGLNSLDKLSLQVQQIAGTQQQKKVASRILNTVSDHHLFLVTLLVGNAMALQWLPLVIHKLMPDWAAIITSTIAVVIVAQIVPMSATTGPQKVLLAYLGAPLVDILIKIYYIISYPIARALDRLLGVHDSSKVKRRDFLALINQKKKNELKPLQICLVNRIFMGPKYVSAQQIMTSLDQIFCVSMQDEVNNELLQKIQQKQSSIILVSQKSQAHSNINITSAIKAKQFAFSYLKLKLVSKGKTLFIKDIIKPEFPINPKDKQVAQSKQLHGIDDITNYNQKRKIPVVYSDTGLLDLMGVFDLRNSRVALVHKERRKRQDTNIAYLDASDYIVYYNPFSEDDRQSIIGVIQFEQVLESVADYKDQFLSNYTFDRQQSPPKKRKLIKRASIVSVSSFDDN